MNLDQGRSKMKELMDKMEGREGIEPETGLKRDSKHRDRLSGREHSTSGQGWSDGIEKMDWMGDEVGIDEQTTSS
jgi:hypothetical protein